MSSIDQLAVYVPPIYTNCSTTHISSLRLDTSIIKLILNCLDRATLRSLAQTNNFFANRVRELNPTVTFAPNPEQIPNLESQPPSHDHADASSAATSPTIQSPRSSEGYESAGSSETDLAEHDQEWEFKMTTAVMDRVASLPDYNSKPSLPGLPVELQLAIFHYLDNIDSVCLGLTNPRSYDIYRALYGIQMPLNTRRDSQNSLDRSWEVVGKLSCRHCGNFRCELYEHIKTWMPEGLEYCKMTKKFGSCADADAKDACYRGKPSKPNRKSSHEIISCTNANSFVKDAEDTQLDLQRDTRTTIPRSPIPRDEGLSIPT